MWLMVHFSHNLEENEGKVKSTSSALTSAYDKALAPYHHFFVRKVAHVSLKLAPSMVDFVKAMSSHGSHTDTVTHDNYDEILETMLVQMHEYITPFEKTLNVIDK